MDLSRQPPLQYFQLKPLKAAKVSEISETTASSSVPPADRVNFHIGHPVYDEKLIAGYQKLVLDLEGLPPQGDTESLMEILDQSEWDAEQIPEIELIREAVRQSVQYAPRGGYSSKNPHKIIPLLHRWFTEWQPEPLEYDTGTKTGLREFVLASGGITECLRVFFHSLDKYLTHDEISILSHKYSFAEHLQQFSRLHLDSLSESEDTAMDELQEHLFAHPDSPNFLVLGTILSEKNRRILREYCLKYPLIVIEVNDALNHLSLAREAGMLNTVIRFLNVSAIDPSFSEVALNMAAGNADFIKIFETTHFQLKGTPSAPEMELLAFLLDKKFQTGDGSKPAIPFKHSQQDIPAESESTVLPASFSHNGESYSRLAERVSKLFTEKTSRTEHFLENLTEKGVKIQEKLQTLSSFSPVVSDPFSHMDRHKVVEEFFANLNSATWQHELEQSFLSNFLAHNPEYNAANCHVVSGSARTALSLIGFHCGITEVVIPDLSWTYEHGFPKVDAVPLGKNLTLDSQAIIREIRSRLEQDPDWKSYGAVVLNNPHNASGQVFDEESVTELTRWLLENEIYLIDDLSYQDVAPSDELDGPKTLREIGNDLVTKGYLRKSRAKKLITVRSLSKTDCFAGARLVVVEIPDKRIRVKFQALNSTIKPNTMATLLSYLFYRNDPGRNRQFWRLRNQVFEQRMLALEEAQDNLPVERNPFRLDIRRPAGAMYPQLVLQDLPAGVSLDWLASSLATRGIGLVPLTTFARTSAGYELARKTFRLTLGGSDNADTLLRKSRRVLIELNRIIDEEASNYIRKTLPEPQVHAPSSSTKYLSNAKYRWNYFKDDLYKLSKVQFQAHKKSIAKIAELSHAKNEFFNDHLPERIEVLDKRFRDRLNLAEHVVIEGSGQRKSRLIEILDRELYKENLQDRESNFRHRLFDRTVHPTQMYSLDVDITANHIIDTILHDEALSQDTIRKMADELIDEYTGVSVPLTSIQEADELVTDLRTMIETEDYAMWHSDVQRSLLLSFWGDWDGSTRPSGQGHRLAAAALVENVTQLSQLLNTLLRFEDNIDIAPELLSEVRQLDSTTQNFWDLLNQITSLTNQLEKRYQRVLPVDMKPSGLRKLGMKLGIARDPVNALWQHNDRLERRMVKLRDQRRDNLEYYFSLNKRLRKTLRANLPTIENHLKNPEMALNFGLYRDVLKRFVLTPRIHQKMILAQDQFAIDTNVHNITEINEIAGKYGNPGMVMALQVSMSSDPEAFIALDRKLRSQRDEVLRRNQDLTLASIFVIPLFEDKETLDNLDNYLNRVWDYAGKSRRLDQPQAARFREMVCELFIAGSDLSQQVSQQVGASLYKEFKHESIHWFAERGLVGDVRIKLGSGEPMQRQGGYYDPHAGESVLLDTSDARERLSKNVDEATMKSVEYARSPLRGVWASGEFRTFQSNIFEHIRRLSASERADLFHHVADSQHSYEEKLIRASEPILETRLKFRERGFQELEMLTLGRRSAQYNQFLELVTKNYRQILYGREEDVLGIHAISYFMARTMPALRDRPVVRPSSESGKKRGQQIVERIAETLPLAKHGSLLRAIGHNRSQSVILGYNQLTTGLFRAMRELTESKPGGGAGVTTLTDKILPHLPIYDILHTLRIYQEPSLEYIKRMEKAFPASNSSFLNVREDMDSLFQFLPLFQKELIRRHGFEPEKFFTGSTINSELLPVLRPDIAVLLQKDLFNTRYEDIIQDVTNSVPNQWEEEVKILLERPVKIQSWRKMIWELIEKPIMQQVESFVELSMAIHSLASEKQNADLAFTTDPARAMRLGTQVTESLRDISDDSMRQFLLAAVQYLTQVPEDMSQIPVDVIRALRDVERIVKIEEQALEKKEQNLLRFYLLQIARIAGENG